MINNEEKHLLTIDILKGVAIWLIILVHSRQNFDNLYPWLKIFDIGQMGCQMFFVISGFSAVLSYGRMADQSHSVQKFYKKRILAIIPGWYTMIFIVYILNTISLALSGNTIGFATNRQPLSIICNLLLLQGLLPFCNNNVAAGGWFIGTLMIFYLVTPFFYRYMVKQNNFLIKCIPWIVEVVSCSLIFGLYFLTRNKYGNAVLANNGFIYFSFINQIGCFLLGIEIYFEENIESTRLLYVLLNILALFVVFFSNWKTAFIIVPFVMGLMTYYLMKYMLTAEMRNSHIYENNIVLRILRAYGQNSYYIYLVHGLFVWSMPLLLRRLLSSSDIYIDDNLLYLLLIVPMFVLSYYTALLLQKMVVGMKGIRIS